MEELRHLVVVIEGGGSLFEVVDGGGFRFVVEVFRSSSLVVDGGFRLVVEIEGGGG